MFYVKKKKHTSDSDYTNCFELFFNVCILSRNGYISFCKKTLRSVTGHQIMDNTTICFCICISFGFSLEIETKSINASWCKNSIFWARQFSFSSVPFMTVGVDKLFKWSLRRVLQSQLVGGKQENLFHTQRVDGWIHLICDICNCAAYQSFIAAWIIQCYICMGGQNTVSSLNSLKITRRIWGSSSGVNTKYSS